jgi:hypothetical protein
MELLPIKKVWTKDFINWVKYHPIDKEASEEQKLLMMEEAKDMWGYSGNNLQHFWKRIRGYKKWIKKATEGPKNCRQGKPRRGREIIRESKFQLLLTI